MSNILHEKLINDIFGENGKFINFNDTMKTIISKFDEYEISYRNTDGNVTLKSIMDAVAEKTIINKHVFDDNIIPYSSSNTDSKVINLNYYFAGDARYSHYNFLNEINGDIRKVYLYGTFCNSTNFTNIDLSNFNSPFRTSYYLKSTFTGSYVTDIYFSSNSDIHILDKDVFNYCDELSNIITDGCKIYSHCDTILFKTTSLNSNTLGELLSNIVSMSSPKVTISMPIQKRISNILVLINSINNNQYSLIYGGEVIV